MAEQSNEVVTLSKRHLLRGVLIALIALLLGGAVFLAGATFGRFHQIGSVYSHRFGGFGVHRFAGRVGPHAHATYGSVKSVGTSTFDLITNGGNTLTVTLNDNSVILDQGRVVNLSDLKAGDEVSVFGVVAGTIISATRVIINPSTNPTGV